MQELMVLEMFTLFDLLPSLVRLYETCNYFSNNSMLRALVYAYEGYLVILKSSVVNVNQNWTTDVWWTIINEILFSEVRMIFFSHGMIM